MVHFSENVCLSGHLDPIRYCVNKPQFLVRITEATLGIEADAAN
jgi:hypothetical protein